MRAIDHRRPGDEVTQPLAAAGQQHYDAANEVKARQHVDVPEHVANHNGPKPDRSAVHAHDAQACEELAQAAPEQALRDDVVGHPEQDKPRPCHGGGGREGR